MDSHSSNLSNQDPFIGKIIFDKYGKDDRSRISSVRYMRIGSSCVLIIFDIFILVELNNKTNIMEINLILLINEKHLINLDLIQINIIFKKYKTNYYYYII